ncbi:N-acetyltransferase family protein [Arthrobacter sp.]|uniref:GNAT family N-acetyltransferase n=1 Tax=Arthrobacter sp. TaxID=1667 RepID=UPI00281285D1|nr:N-acetyltransferase family protein [Arthrobacter sp.]
MTAVQILQASSGIRVRQMSRSDWSSVERIYAAGILGGNATFDATTPTEDDFYSRRIPGLSLVAEDDGGIMGWAAAAPTSSRPVYSGVVDYSVYVDIESSGRGVARALLEALCACARDLGYWSIQASVFPENAGSIALHHKAGFREVGRMERIALMNHGPFAGQWRDTVIFQKRL